ncbi:hypothetical protein [Actinoplanes sp. GCM10030250]|uniref:hypothetical protein n=1 Tax=Actinoplanes sp. GCM10030250 TaxID=3273376 RepID=UPI0036177556
MRRPEILNMKPPLGNQQNELTPMESMPPGSPVVALKDGALTGSSAAQLGRISFMSFDFNAVSRALIRRFLGYRQKTKSRPRKVG